MLYLNALELKPAVYLVVPWIEICVHRGSLFEAARDVRICTPRAAAAAPAVIGESSDR